MRIRVERLEAASRSANLRALLAMVLGVLGVLFFGFLSFALSLVLLELEAGDGALKRLVTVALAFLFGYGPLLASALTFAWGARERRRFGRLGRLALVVLQAPELTPPQLAHALRLSRHDVDRLLSDAVALGIVEGLAPFDVATVTPDAKARARAPASAPTATSFAATVLADSADAGAPRAASSGRLLALASSSAHASGVAPTRRAALGFGTILGGAYQVEEPLGEGAMGAVHAARHLRTGRRYAVKTMLAGADAGEDALRRFEREATAASALGHPGIVQVHDFNVTPEGLFYLVMDLLEGETLEQRIERVGPLPWAEARRIAVELCAALGAAHEHGLLHRDLKPSNVFLAKSSRASNTAERTVLVDFGLVKALDDRAANVTTTGAVIGTPMYMSPEQARGEALDVRSDLYSLGAVLFECLTGSPPFVDRSVAAVYARLLKEPPPRASRVGRLPFPLALDDLLLRALAKDRAARFPTALALGEALAAVSEEEAPRTEAFREGAPATEPAPEDAPATQAAPATERMSR